MYMPRRRALPTLFLTNDEYAILDEMATERNMAVCDILHDLIKPVVKGEGRVVVLNIPDETYQAFAAFFDGEEPETAMERCIEADGLDFAKTLRK